MISRRTWDGNLAQRAIELAGGLLTLRRFREHWERYGWRYEPSGGDEFGFRVDTLDGWTMLVAPLGGTVTSAVLPLLYWDADLSPERVTARREKLAFDEAFDSALGAVSERLSAPQVSWTDCDDDRHRVALWETPTAVLIVQQAAFDVQFGVEVNIWIENARLTEIVPSTPFIDVLTSRAHPSQAEGEAPSLVW